MAIALTEFRALCGFRPFFELSIFLRDVPELQALVPPLIYARFTTFANSADPNGLNEKHALKDVWSAVMTATPEQVKEELARLIKRYKDGGVTPAEESVKDLVITVEEQFPSDVGVFCIFLLNVVDLKPGEAIFLGAGEPHAYISGGASLLPLLSFSLDIKLLIASI
jgi:mannose-6-phosphate isomerase